MFSFGRKKKMDNNLMPGKFPDNCSGENIQMTPPPRYEYTIKLFELDANDKPITTIQNGIKANSDKDLIDLYAMCDQKIQIIDRKEINPPSANNVVQKQQNKSVNQFQTNFQPQTTSEPPTPKYFSAGGLDFKVVGDDVFQKQWIRATEEECNNIRIVNNSNNRIIELKDKHIEIKRWIKIDSSDQL